MLSLKHPPNAQIPTEKKLKTNCSKCSNESKFVLFFSNYSTMNKILWSHLNDDEMWTKTHTHNKLDPMRRLEGNRDDKSKSNCHISNGRRLLGRTLDTASAKTRQHSAGAVLLPEVVIRRVSGRRLPHRGRLQITALFINCGPFCSEVARLFANTARIRACFIIWLLHYICIWMHRERHILMDEVECYL